MAHKIRRVDYFYVTVKDQPGEAYSVLSHLAELGVNLLAVTAVPIGPMTTQMQLFPEDTHKLTSAAAKAKLHLSPPQQALLVQGDDELGALAKVHARLADAKVNVYATSGVADGQGHYGYLIYLRPEEFEHATRALDL
jgi:predicted amino acid-binding ACT domain protein